MRRDTIPGRRRPLLLAALVPALLAGCAGSNTGVESVHQPVVSRADYVLDVAARGGALAPGETRRLAGWLDTLKIGYGDRVSIDDPAGGATLRTQVAGVLGEHGLLLADEAPATPYPVAPGTARIVVSRMAAAVPGCSDWSRMAGSYVDASAGSNYGCAVNTNLAAMVASPSDLVQGAGGRGNDPATSYKAIDTYRKAAPSGAGGAITKSETTGGK
jgi:pilus assembly protein CpaD